MPILEHILAWHIAHVIKNNGQHLETGSNVIQPVLELSMIFPSAPTSPVLGLCATTFGKVRC